MRTSPLVIEVHPSEFPAAARAAVLEGLRAGRIPGRFLYQSDAQAQRWLEYHQACSPARVDPGIRNLYRDAFRAAVGALEDRPCAVVSLGCGGGQKDGDLFEEIGAAHLPQSAYVPLDTSAALVLEATLHVGSRHPPLRAHPLVVNLQAEPALQAWLDERMAPGLPRLFCALGLLPNLDPEALLAYLRRLLRDEDLLLLSANQSPRGWSADAARILAQYDNAPARAWYLGAVASLGIPPAEIELKIATVCEQADGGWWRIDVTVVPRKDLEVKIHGETLVLPAGKTLALFHSHRFTSAALRSRLDVAGLQVRQLWEGAAGEEAILLVQPGSSAQ